MATSDPSGSLHITIGVHPSDELDFGPELRLIKSALLYADKIKLCSLQASILRAVNRSAHLPDKRRFELVEQVIPYLVDDPKKTARVAKNIRDLRDPRQMGQPHVKANKVQFTETANQAWSAIQQVLSDLSKNAGWDELQVAIHSGIVESHVFEDERTEAGTMQYLADCIMGASGKSVSVSADKQRKDRVNKQVQEFVQLACDAVASGKTYPLFD
ncbi:MAG: hypothetical protein L0287_01225, partial [Anaerolineae bacterium]|nr:hypothetical protein [Anaerolineae bacterium]